MKNGFGLKQFYNFLNIPFLKKKRTHLEDQLKALISETKSSEKEIELLLEQDYDTCVPPSLFCLCSTSSIQHTLLCGCCPVGSYVTWLAALAKKSPSKPKSAAKKEKDKKDGKAQVASQGATKAVAALAKQGAEAEEEEEGGGVEEDGDELATFHAGKLDTGFFGDSDDGEGGDRPEHLRRLQQQDITRGAGAGAPTADAAVAGAGEAAAAAAEGGDAAVQLTRQGKMLDPTEQDIVIRS